MQKIKNMTKIDKTKSLRGKVLMTYRWTIRGGPPISMNALELVWSIGNQHLVTLQMTLSPKVKWEQIKQMKSLFTFYRVKVNSGW